MRPFSFTLALFSLLFIGAAADAAPEVDVPGGRVVGSLEGDIAVFNGVPFAAPPTGDLRWRPRTPWCPGKGFEMQPGSGPSVVRPPRAGRTPS